MKELARRLIEADRLEAKLEKCRKHWESLDKDVQALLKKRFECSADYSEKRLEATVKAQKVAEDALNAVHKDYCDLMRESPDIDLIYSIVALEVTDSEMDGKTATRLIDMVLDGREDDVSEVLDEWGEDPFGPVVPNELWKRIMGE